MQIAADELLAATLQNEAQAALHEADGQRVDVSSDDEPIEILRGGSGAAAAGGDAGEPQKGMEAEEEEDEGEEETGTVDVPLAQTPAAAPLPATPADANLLRELECVVCKDVMLRPFSVCHEGHASACLPCYKQLKACPACRGGPQSPPTRIRSLEGLAKNILVPCPGVADGCPLDALRYADAGAHADVCDWRKVMYAKKAALYDALSLTLVCASPFLPCRPRLPIGTVACVLFAAPVFRLNSIGQAFNYV